METKYPEIEVQLIGEDGNALAIVGAVKNALRRADVPRAEISEFVDEALSGDYNNVILTTMKWVEVV